MADDFIQQLFTSANQAELEARFVVVVWLFALGLWLCGMPRLVASLLVLLASMQLIQLSHVSFFGEPLAAPDIVSLFADFAEVRETGWASFADHWHVLPTVLLPYGLLLALHLWLPRHVRLPQSRWALLIIVLVLAAKPWRATYRDYNSFLPEADPQRPAQQLQRLRLLWRAPGLPPGRNAAQKAPFVPYRVSPVASGAKHVWVVVADSLRTDRLGLFGHERTPPQPSTGCRPRAHCWRGPASPPVATAVSLPCCST